MASAPQIKLRDGSEDTTTDLVFTTNRTNIFLVGTVGANTSDVQVSVNNQPFVSDPTLVLLDGINITVPNPASFPEGLTLALGLNVIRIRAIDIVGSVSPPATATITRTPLVDSSGATIPTGIRVRRRRNNIDILAAAPRDPTFTFVTDTGDIEVGGQTFNFRGYNFYASTDPGGTSGYFKINRDPVTTESSTVIEEDEFDVASNQVDFDPDNFTDAFRVRSRVTLEDNFGQEVAVISDVSTQIRTTEIGLLDEGIPQAFGGAERALRFKEELLEFERTQFIFFRHNRAGGVNHSNSDQWVDVEDTDPLYYVVSGIFFNPLTQEEFETPFSQEVIGLPLVIDTRIRDLPNRTAAQVTTSFVQAIVRVNEEISLIPGSTTRDVSIDPFASEAERLWFIVDFVHRSQSFLTLLQIDDANQDEISDPVFNSAYKQALKAAMGFQTDAAVQTLIDTQFDKLAGNVRIERLPGRQAFGQVVFFTETRPTSDITIPSGTIVTSPADPETGRGSARFLVGGTFTLPSAEADAFFNFETQRYELIVGITAETPGSSGNRPAGQITSVEGGVGLSVINTEATVFGTDRESNHDLAVRAQLAYVSVDAGTEGGYAKTAAEQVGIVKSKIVKSGDTLMMRDYDEVRKKHIGGKVDVWVQGLRERTVSETFAFSFEVARDIRCQIVDLSTLTFRVLDDRVTPETPIDEVLNNPAQGLGVRNITLGQDYDLTGAAIVDFQTFSLDETIQSFTTGIDDIVTADYRFRSVNLFTFTFQPVRRVVSVVGEVSGALDASAGYDLFKTGDPLLEGESTIAEDFLRINQVGGIPTGNTISVTDEAHVMIGFFEERLSSIGINTATLRVFSEDRTIEYDGPGTIDPDFEIIEGSATTPVAIRRAQPSDIVSGQTVVVDYDHDENFTVTYVINDLLQQLQRTINAKRHITADVLVKQAILNSVDIETTIQLKQGASKDTTDPAVRSNVSTELNSKLIGEGTAQSDMVNAIDSSEGVDFQTLPLARMGYADGSRKLREAVSSANSRLDSLDIGGQRVFILSSGLQFPTTDGGGLGTEHKGVFQDDEAMVLSGTLATIGENPNQAFIIGAGGAFINGFSDDATIIADIGSTDPDNIEAERLRRTANHVVVSLSAAGTPPDDPNNHVYTCSYVIREDRGPHNITASEVEFIDLGNFTLTFRGAT